MKSAMPSTGHLSRLVIIMVTTKKPDCRQLRREQHIHMQQQIRQKKVKVQKHPQKRESSPTTPVIETNFSPHLDHPDDFGTKCWIFFYRYPLTHTSLWLYYHNIFYSSVSNHLE